jgi:putative ABC transport system permease protein
VILVPIRQVIDKIISVLDRLAFGVRLLGAFTVLAGIAILAGAVGAGTIRRGREVALLKTLGMTRRGVAAAFALEYALVGLVAGAIGSVAGTVLARTVLTRGMQIPWRFDAPALAIGIAGTVLLSIVAGLAASYRALQRRPIEVLRGAV